MAEYIGYHLRKERGKTSNIILQYPKMQVLMGQVSSCIGVENCRKILKSLKGQHLYIGQNVLICADLKFYINLYTPKFLI